MNALLLMAALTPFRPPAVPLIVHTPYFSAWCETDKLTDNWPRHWAGAIDGMFGMVLVDGKPYRFMGPEIIQVPALEQTALEVTATRSTYTFKGAGIELKVEFMSPLLAKDLEVLGRPVSYITMTAQWLYSKTHRVEAYLDLTAEWVVGDSSQKVMASRYKLGDMEALSFHSQEQPVLQKSGDRIRIDWGGLYVAAPGAVSAIGGHASSRQAFADGKPAAGDDMRFPRSADDDYPVLAFRIPFGSVGSPVSKHVLVAYDEDYAIEYFHRKLRPYWNRREEGIGPMLQKAEHEYAAVREKCVKFDAEVTSTLTKARGAEYAQLCSLAYRQCLAGHGMVEDLDGSLLMFPKENTSNGCIVTVDVIFPACPFFLYFNPDLLKAQLRPVLEYAAMPRWRWPFAPHDLGQYPLANGQVYGGGERTEEDQMPVEESANMLIMVAALCRLDKSAGFAKPYLKQLGQWAEYLLKDGLDPKEQLCTDDFTGHLAHNTNLSVKAIVALRGYSEVCELAGDAAGAKRFSEIAHDWAGKWMKMADDGDHYRLTFDKAGTWSTKYNLMWDHLLGYNLFPAEVTKKELAYYGAKLNAYGFPLDNRATFAKGDWLFWAASLATDQAQFEKLTLPMYRYLNETKTRVPFSDWHDTISGNQMGMNSRTVIGGVFAPMLERSEKLAKRAENGGL